MTNKRILGIDYGEKKIGLALGVNDLVSPLTTLDYIPNHKLEEDAFKKIVEIVEEERISDVVIGLPLVKEQETEMSKKIREFGFVLGEKLPEETVVHYTDETGSSKDAVSNAVNMDISKSKRSSEHELAACEIIRRFVQEIE